MKIKWLGHAAFLITSDSGTKIITDPYKPEGPLAYGEIEEDADIVTVSHDHFDHCNVDAVGGNPVVVRESGMVKGIPFTAVSTFHDDAAGEHRGPNTVFCFDVDGMRICHLGDIGHRLGEKELGEMGDIDVLLIPVGGNFTVDVAAATGIGNKLSPKVIFPMHFMNEKCGLPIAGVEDYLRGKKNVKKPDASEVELKKDDLPVSTEIWVLLPEL